jgi:N-acylneuraminate cytidylyltransferase
MNILAIIPARGGSKGIPRKNIKLLAGKPLIAYSIEAAVKSKYINKLVVSTEDEEISRVSKSYNADVIMRPEELARDDSLTIDAVIHVLNFLENEGYFADLVVLLQPTSPLRTYLDINESIELFIQNKGKCDSIVSVCEFEHSPYWSLKIEDGYIKPIFGDNYLKTRRQDLPKSFIPNGAISISTSDKLKKSKTFYTNRTLPYFMKVDKSIDMDSQMDFSLAQLILREEKK